VIDSALHPATKAWSTTSTVCLSGFDIRRRARSICQEKVGGWESFLHGLNKAIRIFGFVAVDASADFDQITCVGAGGIVAIRRHRFTPDGMTLTSGGGGGADLVAALPCPVAKQADRHGDDRDVRVDGPDRGERRGPLTTSRDSTRNGSRSSLNRRRRRRSTPGDCQRS
jgi:hypothetical protein